MGDIGLGRPNSADALLTFRNVHNWVMADNAPSMFQAFFNVLKPGVLGVVDHRAKDGAALARTSTQASALGSRSGNITSIKPNLLKSSMRDGYSRPIR